MAKDRTDDLEAWTDLVALLVHMVADSADRQAELERRLEAIEERFERAIASARQREDQRGTDWPVEFPPPPEAVRVEKE